jgi:Protein of unknown function (DUF2975)
MRPESEAKVNRIKKVSAMLRFICKGLLALVTFVGLCATAYVTFGIGRIDFDGMVFQTGGLSLGLRLTLGIVTVTTWSVLFKCLYHLHSLFGNYSHGEVFTRCSVGQLRQFGIGCVLWGVMSFLWLLSLATSMHPMKTFRGDADALAIGAVIILIAWFMEMAVDLREENDLTI